MDRQKKFMKRREKYLEQNPLYKTDQLAMRQQMERQIQAQAQYQSQLLAGLGASPQTMGGLGLLPI